MTIQPERENSLALHYWPGGGWQDAACGPYDRHPGENWLAVPVCRLGEFAMIGERGQWLLHLPLVLRATNN